MGCKKGKNVKIGTGVIIGENVVLEDNVCIDSYAIIRNNVTIKKGTYVGVNCILGEYQMDYYQGKKMEAHPLVIGENSIIRSGTIIYGDCEFGDHFETGHRATIRENTKVGSHVSIGTLADIQGYCIIGSYTRLHSNVHIGQKSEIGDFVWIFPYVVLTNDPTPPSNEMKGVKLKPFSVIATGSIILPGIVVEEDTLVAAGAIVTKNVGKNTVVAGNPAKVICDISKIKNSATGEKVYPWRDTFKRGMPWEESDYETWYKEMEKQILSE